MTPRHRLAGAGGKPPWAAWDKSPGRERHGKGVVKASGMHQEDEQPWTAVQVSKALRWHQNRGV